MLPSRTNEITLNARGSHFIGCLRCCVCLKPKCVPVVVTRSPDLDSCQVYNIKNETRDWHVEGVPAQDPLRLLCCHVFLAWQQPTLFAQAADIKLKINLLLSHPLHLSPLTVEFSQSCGRSQDPRIAEAPSNYSPSASRRRHHKLGGSPFRGTTPGHVFETTVTCDEDGRGYKILPKNPRRVPNPPYNPARRHPPPRRGAHCCRRGTTVGKLVFRAGQGELSVHGVVQRACFR